MHRLSWQRWGILGGFGGACLMTLAALGTSCSSSASGGSACAKVGEALCAKACACTDGPGCAISNKGLSATFDSPEDCRAFIVTFGCSSGNYKDAAACLPLVQAATCTGTGTEAAVVQPSDPACGSSSD